MSTQKTGFFRNLLKSVKCPNGNPENRILQISTLQHEAFDDSVKDGPLEVKGLSTVPISLLSRAKSPEVVRSLGDHIVEQLESDPTKLLAAKRDVQKATASLNTHSGSIIFG